MLSQLKPLLTGMEIGIVFVALELLLPARRRPVLRLQRYLTDFLHMSVGDLSIRLGTAAVLAVLLAVLGSPSLGGDRLPLWLQVVLVLLISDLMIWLTHRMFHAVSWLWEVHKIHHSSEHLDWLATHRFHPIDQIITTTAVMLPVLLLGFSPEAIAIYFVGYVWHSHFAHSNLKIGLGPLERVVTTPRFHHWHHADHVEAYDRNFGAQLVVWDRLFGTVHEPEQPLPDRYGVDDPPRETFLSHLASPFVRKRRPEPSRV